MIELVEGCHQKSRPTHTRQADLNKICDRRLKTLGIYIYMYIYTHKYQQIDSRSLSFLNILMKLHVFPLVFYKKHVKINS